MSCASVVAFTELHQSQQRKWKSESTFPLRHFRNSMRLNWYHQHVQVPKMEVLTHVSSMEGLRESPSLQQPYKVQYLQIRYLNPLAMIEHPRSPLKVDIPNKYPLYKLYMGLIVRGTIARAPAFSLWTMVEVAPLSYLEDHPRTRLSSLDHPHLFRPFGSPGPTTAGSEGERTPFHPPWFLTTWSKSWDPILQVLHFQNFQQRLPAMKG